MATEETNMNSITNTLTVLTGLLTMGVAALGKLISTIGLILMLPWFPYIIGALGGLCSIIGICKGLHDWRTGIRRERREEAEHRARMELITGKKELNGR